MRGLEGPLCCSLESRMASSRR